MWEKRLRMKMQRTEIKKKKKKAVDKRSQGPEKTGLTDGCYGDGYAAQHCI